MEQIVVFGTGRYYLCKKARLEQDYEVVGFLDSMVKPGTTNEFENLLMINPEDYNIYFSDKKIMLMSAKFWEMYEQLRLIGIPENQILSAINIEKPYDKTEELLNKILLNIAFVNEGMVLETVYEKMNIKCEDDYKIFIRKSFVNEYKEIDMIKGLPLNPFSRRFGHEMGTPIDRIYIEKFLNKNKEYINGVLMEVGEDRYMSRLGHDVKKKIQIHVNGWGKDVILGNLVTGEGIQENMADCFICTQTLTCLFDVDAAVKNIYKLLNPNGSVLLTVSGFAQLSLYDYYKWGEYWRFTEKSIRMLFNKYFEEDKIEISTYGNVKTTTAFIYGISAETLDEEDYEYNDVQYPLIITVRARK